MAYDLSKLYINIDAVPNGVNLVEHFSELSSFKEFIDAGDTITKIAILTGDADSPFVKIRDRETMISAVFDFLEVEKGKLYRDIIDYRSHKYMNAWLKYLYILHETDFTNWLVAKKDFEYFLKKSAEPQGKDEDDSDYLKKRNDIRKTIKDLGEDLKSIEARIFPDSKAAREAALAESKNRIRLYPEKYAQEGNFA